MRFLHTSDWHIGRSFFGVSLLEDQAHALDDLIRVAVDARVDAVLVAGDIYDRSTPPADAVGLLDEVLTRLVIAHGIRVVAIAGNHDSGERLDFGSRLLSRHGMHVAGTRPAVVPFDDADGRIEVVAVPFAEPMAVAARRDDSGILDHDSALRIQLADAAPQPARGKRRRPIAAPRRIAVAHAFVSGGTPCESERPLVMGNAALVAADCFDGFAYAALGHLHRPQRAGRDEVRYCGSLLKYSFDEAAHRKGVSIVEIDGSGACRIEEVALSLRRDVRILAGTLDEVLGAADADRAREDYVMVRLTDREARIDPMGTLRVAYPNCLLLDRDAYFSAQPGGAAERIDPRRSSDTEMFVAFFREMTGEEPGEEEARAFADAVTAVERRCGGEG